ncbi:hypothetical protein TRFO_24871 [Tritrichomonas foetus]|uniref:Uncharacterized protein n=1 Tax=Tritrichomonas foetus TaxID=1144522 RepID=A0A1J4K7K6_9EUKA|nr:hypothetical protein TRFO_24871 [Tritrichomonas foetus]|eukprot:OHT06986.1 hypothetical protein TRFO_24871 [Tritrichomonas foetus]
MLNRCISFSHFLIFNFYFEFNYRIINVLEFSRNILNNEMLSKKSSEMLHEKYSHMKKIRNVKPPNKIPNQEILERVNFLTEVSKISAEIPELVDLSQYLGTEANLAAQKSNIRMTPKRVFCRKCKTPMVPPLTAEFIKKKDFTIIKCKTCNSKFKEYIGEYKTNSKAPHWRFLQEFENNSLKTISESKPQI